MAVPVIVDIQVAQHREANLVVGWRTPVGLVIPPGVKVRILRSYHQEDGFEEIADVPVDQGIYVDSDHLDFSKDVNAYYRLVVHDFGDTETREYGPVHLHDGPDRIARMMIRRVALMLRNIGATPVLIYQVAYGPASARTSDNHDPVGGQPVTGEGSLTGFEGSDGLGYYNPILTLMDFRPADELTTVEDTQQHPRVTTARMANFPILQNNDVVREVNTGRLWKVTAVVPVRKDQRALISQDPVTLRQIKHGDVEWDLPVPSSIQPVMTRRRVRRERILQDNKGSTPQFLEVYV